jgi:hypothetical protein
MLYESDAAIARRDPMLPGLATLLDPEAFGDALRRAAPGVLLKSVRPVYAKYKPGTNCLMGYRCRVNGDDVNVYAKAYPLSAMKKMVKARERPGVAGPLGPGSLALDEISTVVSVYPNDAKVKALPLIADEESRSLVLREIFPDRPELWQGRVSHLAYKPERRLVARLDNGNGPQAVLKTYTLHGYEAPRRLSQRFTSRGALRLAPDLGRTDRHQTLAFGWLPGRLLSDAILDPSFSAGALEPVGAALAELHAQDAGGLPRQTGADVAAALLAEADTLGALVPEIAPRAQILAQRLAARMTATAQCDHPVHGDFHARQVLLADDTAAILDLDQTVQGDPYDDLALFLAHLEREVIRGHLMPERVPALREGLLAGYVAVAGREIDISHLNTYTATILLRLSPRFFRYREPDWPDRIEKTVARAEAILAGAK